MPSCARPSSRSSSYTAGDAPRNAELFCCTVSAFARARRPAALSLGSEAASVGDLASVVCSSRANPTPHLADRGRLSHSQLRCLRENAMGRAGISAEAVTRPGRIEHPHLAGTGFPPGSPQADPGRQSHRAVGQLPVAASYSHWRPRPVADDRRLSGGPKFTQIEVRCAYEAWALADIFEFIVTNLTSRRAQDSRRSSSTHGWRVRSQPDRRGQ